MSGCKWVGMAVATMLASSAWAGETLDAIKARGTLLVGTTGDYKPYSFLDAEGYRGADIEMAKRIAGDLGVKVEFVPTVWGRMMQDFQARKFDMAVGGVTVLPAREAVGAFSPVLVVDGKRPIARCADQDRFTSVAAIDRPDVRVIVNPGAANEEFARKNFPHAQLAVHSDNASVFAEVAAGRADVMVTDGIEVAHQALIQPGLCATHVPAAFTRLEKAYWLQKDPEFDAAVDQSVASAQALGAWDSFLNAAQRQP